MHPKSYKLLRWLLIVMMTVTPLRAVTAGNTDCKMDVANDAASSVMMSEHATDHHEMEQHVHIMDIDDSSIAANLCCCCTDGHESCASNCDMGLTVSLVMRELSFAAVILDVSESVIISSNILLRELAPPSRPPAVIS
jgi:hypothetical protein